MIARRLIFPIVIVLLFIVGCSKPPTQEIGMAKAAIKKARDAEAQKFAKAELTSAESALIQAEKDTQAENYDAARDKAVRAKRQAELAVKTASKNKEIWLENERKREAEMKAAAEEAARAAAEKEAEEAEDEGEEDLFADEGEADLFSGDDEEEAVDEEGDEGDEEAGEDETLAEDTAEPFAEPEGMAAAEEPPPPPPAASAVPVMEEEEEPLDLEEPAPATGGAPSLGDRTTVVEPGDTLWGIAEDPARGLGDRGLWLLIFEANRDKLSSPDKLIVGMELVIPGDISEADKERARRYADSYGEEDGGDSEEEEIEF